MLSMMVNLVKVPIGYLYRESPKNYGNYILIDVYNLNNYAMQNYIGLKHGIQCCRYEMQDLHVSETLPQMVALSEAYMQIYEQHQ